MSITVTIKPTAVHEIGSWVASGGDAVTVVTDENDSTVMSNDTGIARLTYDFEDPPGDGAAPVTEVRIRGRLFDAGSGQSVQLTGKLDSSVVLGPSIFPAPIAWFEWVAPRPDGGAWTLSAVWNAKFGVTPAVGNSIQLAELQAKITYLPTPGQLRNAKDVATRRLLEGTEVPQVLTIDVPVRVALAVEIGDLVSVAHILGPDVHRGMTGRALGWGPRPWERMPARVIRVEIDTARRVGRLGLLLVRDVLSTYRRTGLIRRSYAQIQEGVGVVTSGGIERFRRASSAWVRNPGDDLYYEVGVDVERNEALGSLPRMSSRRTDLVLRASLKSGLTGLGATGGTGTVSAEALTAADARLFDLLVSANCLKLDSTSDLSKAWPATATLEPGAKVRAGMWHREDSTSVTAGYQLTRSVDGRYWRDSDSTWQVSTTNNAVSNRVGTVIADNLDISKTIDVGNAPTTLTLIPMVIGSGVSRVYHVQLEDGTWISAPIVTDAATYTRERESWEVESVAGKRAVLNGQFSFMCEMIPEFDSVDAPMSAWYRADTIAVGDGLPVGQWDDSSGNGRHLTAPDIKPILTRNAVNGRAAVRFNNVGDRLLTSVNMSALLGANGVGTVFVVHRFDKEASPDDVLWTNGDGSFQGLRLNGPNLRASGYDGTFDVASKATTLAAWHVGMWMYDDINVSVANDDADTAALVSTASGAQTNLENPFVIGATSSGGARLLGHIAEIIVCPAALSEEDRRRYQRYLVSKYVIATDTTTAPPEGANLTVFALRFGPDDYWSLSFSELNQRWEFKSAWSVDPQRRPVKPRWPAPIGGRRTPGGVATAYVAELARRGVAVRLGCRATSSEGELDLPQRSVSVFANGMKGTDAVRGADPVESGGALLRLGSDTLMEPCNGVIRYPRFTQVVRTDLEFARRRW